MHGRDTWCVPVYAATSGFRYSQFDAKLVAQACTRYADTSTMIDDICRTLTVSLTTLWRAPKDAVELPNAALIS